eukprot:TRINITY_DN3195_c0_g1_i3.p1 TRINITY_DN3195_c0_g1~~TRINITY_DN3195_c0_g1_i3.p1  ORF type:complete len:420 (-),score=52.29 TRINITY_DN3195_c0_g1_i3:451-1710(-)
MAAAKLCQAASRRLGYHMRRCSVAHCRRELRVAQKAVDDSQRVILAAALADAELRTSRQLDDLLCALTCDLSAAAPSVTGALQQTNAGTQTDHLLRSQIHALACSRGTDNPKQELAEPFELRLTVSGPELNNSAGVVACSDPLTMSKIKVNGMALCFGELLWTTKQLLSGAVVECKLSTNEVVRMSRRIHSARASRAKKGNDWDDSCSEASTEAGTSLSCTLSESEHSGSEAEHSATCTSDQEVLSKRRKTTPASLPVVPEEVQEGQEDRARDSDALFKKEDLAWCSATPLKRYCFVHTEAYYGGLLDELQRLALKTYSFQHSQSWVEGDSLVKDLQSLPLKTYGFRHSEAWLQARTCCCGRVMYDLTDSYWQLLARFQRTSGDSGELKLERFLEKKALTPGCDGTKALLLLNHRRTLL